MKEWEDDLKEWAIALLIGATVILLVRSFIVTTYQIDGDSMLPTLHSGDQVVVSLISSIEPGDLVIVQYSDQKDIVKRVIGVPGDRIEFRANQIFVNSVVLEEPYIYEQDSNLEDMTIELEEDRYFVLGDNRERSLDSRDLGTFTTQQIIGEVKFIYYPFQHFSAIHY
ncbi:signal peptidase I [Chryseomicrobium sp. FSL W7-1435]|uniref:signal peptidase I n=1 Tax=Chryseomicrobium sp. FSL W7-1435 TaxID=2921704 RepID=UPI00315AB8C1